MGGQVSAETQFHGDTRNLGTAQKEAELRKAQTSVSRDNAKTRKASRKKAVVEAGKLRKAVKSLGGPWAANEHP